MINFLTANNILTNKQFGFHGGRSTESKLRKVIDKWTEIFRKDKISIQFMDRGGMIDVIYCDFRKAFDTVPHNQLLSVLTHGITDPILSWVKDFLLNRKYQIAVNGRKSEIHHVTLGVPQGTVNRPLLFVTFINLMVDKAESLEIIVYTDDLKIYNEIKSPDDVEAFLNEIDKLYYCTQYSLVGSHPGKCVTM